MLDAMAAQARGEVRLAEGDAQAALVALRHAHQAWQELDAPHEAARARVLLALTCRSLGDEESATFDLEAARGALAELGPAPALAWVDPLSGRGAPADEHEMAVAREGPGGDGQLPPARPPGRVYPDSGIRPDRPELLLLHAVGPSLLLCGPPWPRFRPAAGM